METRPCVLCQGSPVGFSPLAQWESGHNFDPTRWPLSYHLSDGPIMVAFGSEGCWLGPEGEADSDVWGDALWRYSVLHGRRQWHLVGRYRLSRSVDDGDASIWHGILLFLMTWRRGELRKNSNIKDGHARPLALLPGLVRTR